jgi:sugar phosphate isomerase/epimerase
MDRRSFIRHTACFSALMSGVSVCPAQVAEPSASQYPIALFTKLFQRQSFEDLADAIVKVGTDGVEATLRGGGHIEPAMAADEVPRMVEVLAARGKKLLIAAADVNEATPENEKFLRVLKENGVEYYRVGYLKYEKGRSPQSQLKPLATQLQELSAMNAEVGVTGLYQNHAGPSYVGSLIWDLAFLLDGISPKHLGVALDLRHLCAEIASSHPLVIDLVRPHLRSIYAKDTSRSIDNELKEVPLGEGIVNKGLFQSAWKSVPPAPLSVHVEYFGQKPIPASEIGPVIEASKRDVATLRSWMV